MLTEHLIMTELKLRFTSLLCRIPDSHKIFIIQKSIMLKPLSIKERTPLWIALSDFYLDTELQDSDFRYIAKTILESPYTFEEVKTINTYEIFPVLQSNLLQPAGEWACFNEKWLIEAITAHLETKNR